MAGGMVARGLRMAGETPCMRPVDQAFRFDLATPALLELAFGQSTAHHSLIAGHQQDPRGAYP